MSTNKIKIYFFILLCIFLFPLIGAWYLFHHPAHLTHTTNHGRLLKPMLRLEQLGFKNIPASLRDKKLEDQKWLLFYVQIEKTCDKNCLHNLYFMHQTKIALGKYQNQIQLAQINLYPSTKNFLNIPNLYAKNIQILLPISHQKSALFLSDPSGYIMMVYYPPFNFENIYADLNHLLSLGNNS